MTTLSNIVEKLNQGNYTNEQSVEVNELYQSGVIVSNSEIQALASSGGKTVDLPFWMALPKTEPNASNDNVSDLATPLVMEGAEQTARIAQLNQAFTATDLAVEVAGSDPLQAATDQLNQYWAEQIQRRATATITGIVADSIANHSGDLIHDETGKAFNTKGFLRAAQTLGDNKKKLRALIVHSEVQTLMSENDLIQYIPDSTGQLVVPTFKGLQLLVDDQVEHDGTTFDCYLVGQAAIGSAAGTPKNALAIERSELACNGGGNEVLVSRVSPVVHPVGYKWTESSVTGKSPVLADLRKAANWSRVMTDRKSLPLAMYRCDLVDAA